MRLISSATVKGRGEEEERRGTDIWGGQLVLMTFRMQHPGRAANITNGIMCARLGQHAGGGRAIRAVVISTRRRAAILSGRLDMIIESASGETVAAEAISAVRSHFKVNQQSEVLDFSRSLF